MYLALVSLQITLLYMLSSIDGQSFFLAAAAVLSIKNYYGVFFFFFAFFFGVVSSIGVVSFSSFSSSSGD